jgi:hypothetical protein
MVARLESIKRGIGGDIATYKEGNDTYIVFVGWALLSPFYTDVLKNGSKVATFDDARYVQPPEALSRLGLEVNGTVDFATDWSLSRSTTQAPIEGEHA